MSEPTESALFHHTPSLTLAGARKAIVAAQQSARTHGWKISVAVVDPAGQLLAFEKQDGASGVTIQVACEKAKTAALLGEPSKAFEDFINNGHPSFLSTPGVTPLEGGIPVIVGGVVIGAVGVSGAHGENDSYVANAAAQAVEEAVK